MKALSVAKQCWPPRHTPSPYFLLEYLFHYFGNNDIQNEVAGAPIVIVSSTTLISSPVLQQFSGLYRDWINTVHRLLI